MATTDPADRIAQELADWLELRSTQVANAILESPYRPRVVEPTTAETLAYFHPLLLNPDGSINEAGKAQVIQQYGAAGYRDVATALARHVRQQGPPLAPVRLRPPTNTDLMLGQLPEPAAAGPPLLATPGGA